MSSSTLDKYDDAAIELGLSNTSKPIDTPSIDWDSPKDIQNPLNWSGGKKWTHIVIVATIGLIT